MSVQIRIPSNKDLSKSCLHWIRFALLSPPDRALDLRAGTFVSIAHPVILLIFCRIECNSYSHCLDMLRNEEIEVMLVDVHAASWLQKSEKEKNANLVKKGQMAVKIPISAFVRTSDAEKLKGLFNCISQNSSLVTSSLRRAYNGFEVSLQTAVLKELQDYRRILNMHSL